MRRAASLATLVVLFSALILPSQDALALPTCPSSTAYDYVSNGWFPSGQDAAGIRAPIQMRVDGAVCTGGPQEGFASGWIAINKSDGSSISQIGFLHFWDSSLQVGRYCRFWAIDGGGVHTYGCGGTSDQTWVWFKVEKFFNPDTHAYYYNIQDCGTGGGYMNCSSENATQAAYSSAFGVVAAETEYGRSGCTVQIMGSSSDKQNFGNSSYPIKGLRDGGSWEVRDFTPSPAVCSHYQGDFTDSIMKTWDDRNSS